MSDQTLFSIFFSAMIVNNFTLAMFLGLCPFMGVSARVETAIRMGMANIFVLVLTSLSAWVLNTYILVKAPYLRIISFIIVVASLVQIVEMVIKKVSPVLFRQLGIYLPLITTNCAIFGLAIFQTNRGYDFLQGLVFAVGAGLLGPVQYRDAFYCMRQRIDQCRGRKRAIQAHPQHTDLFALAVEIIDDFRCRLGARAHQYHDALGLRVTRVVDQPVAAPAQFAETFHRRVDHGGEAFIEGVHGFTPLEIHIRVLR